MIRVIQRRLIIPRGDTGIFTIPAMTQAEGAIGVFTIFDPITNTRIFQKQVEIEGENFNISFSHADTVNLKAGDYLWDIKFYKNPILADNKVIDGEEINSYYAAFQAPKCEIRETGDDFLMIEGQPAKIEDLNIILGATEAANAAKIAATEQAGIAATKAEEAAARLSEMIAAIPTKVSELENDSGYLQEETDPTVPAWAKAQTKPTYTSQEVGALPANTFIPSKVSDLTDDSGHYMKPANGIPASDLEETYLTEHQDISGKANIADLAVVATSGSYDDLSNKPIIPDVQINGSSIVNNGVANIPIASTSDMGVVKVGAGLSISGTQVYISPASNSDIKSGNQFNKPVVPSRQHNAVFYGLAKAAGDTTQSQSELEVGQYTDTAKAAIQQMLGVPSTADIPTVPTNVSAFTNDVGYLTQHQDISGKANSADLATVATSGDYDDLINKPIIPEVPVQDVQIEGTSILENGVVNIPLAVNGVIGVVKTDPTGDAGIGANATSGNSYGKLTIFSALSDEVKAGKSRYKPIVPKNQHTSVFYGLSKVAGADLANEENITIGTYPDSAKTAIQQMLGVPSTAAIPSKVSQLQNDSGYLTSFTETDPTVPEWAKAAQKPSYTAAEVGAPTVQEMNSAISTAIGNVNSFDMAVVQALPEQDISTHTIYLVPKTGETNDVYDEYVYINNAWEMVGNTQIDLSNYVQKDQYATSSTPGLVATGNNNATGLNMNNGIISIYPATASEYKQGITGMRPIGTDKLHLAAFYGLAKAAGDTTQRQSDNEVGTYTTEAKAAIRSMIGAAASADVTVQDVQVNGQSITTNGVANVALGSGLTSMANPLTNIQTLVVQSANSTRIKNGTELFFPIAPARQHESAFYGLAKAAGDITQSQSENAVGTYTAEAKAAILNMLGAAANSDIPDTSIYATKADTVLETSLSRGRKADTTIGNGSFAFGYNVEASGNYSYATGQNTIASGMRSYAEGLYTLASGGNSHAIGTSTIANGSGMFSMGRYNVGTITYPNWISGASYSPGDRVSYAGWGFLCINANNDTTIGNNWKNIGMNTQMVMAVGNGTADDARSNAYALDWDGNGHYMGNIYVGANADSTGGTKVLCEADFATAQDIQNIINGGAGA